MGLITDILKRAESEPAKDRYRVHTKHLESRSDVELFKDLVEIAEKMKAGKPVSKEEHKRYKRAQRKLTDRGLIGKVEEEL